MHEQDVTPAQAEVIDKLYDQLMSADKKNSRQPFQAPLSADQPSRDDVVNSLRRLSARRAQAPIRRFRSPLSRFCAAPLPTSSARSRLPRQRAGWASADTSGRRYSRRPHRPPTPPRSTAAWVARMMPGALARRSPKRGGPPPSPSGSTTSSSGRTPATPEDRPARLGTRWSGGDRGRRRPAAARPDLVLPGGVGPGDNRTVQLRSRFPTLARVRLLGRAGVLGDLASACP